MMPASDELEMSSFLSPLQPCTVGNLAPRSILLHACTVPMIPGYFRLTPPGDTGTMGAIWAWGEPIFLKEDNS